MSARGCNTPCRGAADRNRRNVSRDTNPGTAPPEMGGRPTSTPGRRGRTPCMEGADVVNLDEQPAAPVVFRATRERVLRRLVYAVAAGVLAGVGWSVLHVVWLATVATIACLLQFAAAARAAAGTVTADPDGVQVRTISATRRYPWADILGCEVRATLFGRGVRLVRAVPHRR